ncbi:hypothetical protein CJF25_14010 [Photobacterium phosphoreum]|nr:hypothetical protein [Photobacterium phosphoreum]
MVIFMSYFYNLSRLKTIKYIINITPYVLLIISFTTNANNNFIISPQGNNSQKINIEYSEPIRLLTLIKDAKEIRQAKKTSSTYWLGSSLSKLIQPQKKQALIKNLKQLSIKHERSQPLSISFSNNAQWVEKNIHNTRIITPIDIDKVRLNKNHNPLLKGGYKLTLANRPNNILILGAINKPQKLLWYPRKSASYYLQKIALIDDADKSNVIVIQPDGIKTNHPIAYWNNQHINISPGSIIYVNYKSLLHDYSILNNMLSSILINRTL